MLFKGQNFAKHILALGFAAVFATGCGQQNSNGDTTQKTASAPADATTASGQQHFSSKAGEITIPENLTRIAALDGNALATILALGAEDKVVAVSKGTVLPKALQQFADKQFIDAGSAKEANLERVASSQPEVIFINGRMENQVQALKDIAPTYFLDVDYNNQFPSFKQQTLNIAKMVGKTAVAEEKLAKLEADIADIKSKTGDKTALIVMVNNNKLAAYGPHSRFGVIHDLFGFKPADDSIKVGLHGMAISPEFIAEKNPDYIFVIDRGAAITDQKDAAKKVLDNALVNKSNAAKNGNIVYLDSATWYLMTDSLLGMQTMTDEVSQALK
ncbi:siderophore ABC transporter substrate-binding protein [Acinetobacter larvae]|uniref:ABC transporter n=1 Tax=Acinetobacter larvae TaxID=1789224 RepID=A0A1B2LYK5_9GAMM|nr:ABC transporter [Acinetobacter larvae]